MNQIDCLCAQFKCKADKKIHQLSFPLNKILGILPSVENNWFITTTIGIFEITNNFQTCVKNINGNEDTLICEFMFQMQIPYKGQNK